MQRYRVNYRLFIGLIVGVAVAAGAVYGAWQINTNRNADNFLERADKAEQADDLVEAAKLLENYVALRPGDDKAQLRLAYNYIELSEQSLDKRDIPHAINYRKNASTKLARYPDEVKLRRALVDLDIRPGSFGTSEQFNSETIGHIQKLLKDTPDDPELIEGLANCYMFQGKPQEAAKEFNKLIGYDPETRKFDQSKALAPDNIKAYANYAIIVAYSPPRMAGQQARPSLNNFQLSRALIDQVIAANPDNADAYLARAEWFSIHNRGEGTRQDYEADIRADLLKAVELDPKSPAALHSVATHFMQLGIRARDKAEQARNDSNVQVHREEMAKSNELFDTARGYLRQGLELETPHRMFYIRLAGLERSSGNKEEAARIIDEALKKFTGEDKTYVEMTNAEYLLDDGKIGEAEKLLRQFANVRSRQDPALMYLQVKHALVTEQWTKVRDRGKELLPQLAGNPDRQLQLHLWIGFAHQKLAEPELALENFKQALAIDPNNVMAEMQVRSYDRTRGNKVRTGDTSKVTRTNIMDVMREEAAKPENEQNWTAIEEYLRQRAELEEFSPARAKMAEAEYYRFRKMYRESETRLSEALKVASTDPESSEKTDVLLAAINLAASNPKRGPEEGLKMMERIVAEHGDSPMFRIQKVRLLAARNDENMVRDVLAQTTDMEGWKPIEVEAMWGVVATVFEQTRHAEEAEQALAKLAELRTGDLPLRIRMFKSALARNDTEAMKVAQDEILKIVGSKKDPNWAFTEAARLFSTGETVNDAQRAEVERLLAEIMRARGDWHEPYFLRAKLKLTKNDPLGAVDDFKKGFALGQGSLVDLRLYGQLLLAQNRWRDALALVEPYPEDMRIVILEERYPQALFINERYTDAVEAAERMLAMADAKAELHLWHYQFLNGVLAVAPEVVPADQREAFKAMQEECRTKQGEAVDKAVELRPDLPAAWLAKVRHRLVSNKLDEAIAALQEAQLIVEDDFEPAMSAECYTILGRWFDAENLYTQILEQNPDNTSVMRQMATFYLGNFYQRGDKVEKASRLINGILERVVKAPKEVPEIDAQWARRAAAQLLAARQDYQSLLDAEKLLASNSTDGVLPVADKAEMAAILAPRPEQVSKRKAIQLLEEIKKQSSLTLQQDLMLANLYFQTDNWTAAREAMERLTAQQPKSREVRDLYVRMLLIRNQSRDRDTLETQLRQLRSIDPNSLSTLELVAKAADLQGQNKAARDMLRKLVPADFGTLDPRGIATMARVAQLLTDLKDIEGAEAIYKGLAGRADAPPQQKGVLAHFVGKYRDPAVGFEMLENLQHDIEPMVLIEAAIGIAGAHRKTAGDAYDERVERWINRALREDPESFEIMLKQADFRDQQGRHEDAAAIYRTLLNNPNVTGPNRAVVLNNLSYMLALGVAKPTAPNEAAKHINEAVRLLGPMSDILDTRAVVYMGREDYKGAAEDLKLAVIDKPTDSKYFHLALALIGMDRLSEARDAWEKGKKLGLTRESVNALEQEKYDKAAAKLEGS